MTDQFDFDIHDLVAVVRKGQGRGDEGQHLHVGPGRLIQELRGYAAKAGEPVPEIIETVREVQSLPAETLEQITFIAKRLEALDGRLTEIASRLESVEARPYVSEETVRQLNDGLNAKFKQAIEKLVNASLGDIRSRVVTIERNQTHAPAVVPASDDSPRLRALSNVIDRLAEYVESFQREADSRHDDLEQRYAEIAAHIEAVNANMNNINVDALRMKGRMMRALTALESDEEKGAA